MPVKHINPPTDRPFETIKFPISFVHTWWCHLNSVGKQAVQPFKSIQMVLEGPLIHHLHL